MDLEKARSVIEETFREYTSAVFYNLSRDLQNKIEYILLGDHLTFRYMLFTALLAKVVDCQIHMRAIQAQANLQQAYDARSLCHRVIVPFEKSILGGRLGNSNEPYLNKPARFQSIEKSNPVRSGNDKDMLCKLYDVLEELNDKNDIICKEALLFAMKTIMQRDERISETVILPPLTISADGIRKNLFTFLQESYEGEAPVAIMGAILQQFYSDAQIIVHPANEAGTSSNEIGDIDIKFFDSVVYAVEVKDKLFTETDINHAVEKVLAQHETKAIFALGANAQQHNVNNYQIIDFWRSRGVDLSFVNIPTLLEQCISMLGTQGYNSFLEKILTNLYNMRAKDATIRAFKSICQ